MALAYRRLLITGSEGFIGRNVFIRFGELEGVQLRSFARGDDPSCLRSLLAGVDAVIHLAGENRPADEAACARVNTDLTKLLCAAVQAEWKLTGRHLPILLASSTQAVLDNAYGRSKLAAELALEELASNTGNPSLIFRLPGVFGKWCKPNYNSVVATFCHNVARDLPIQINDRNAEIDLVYVDDVVNSFVDALSQPIKSCARMEITPKYNIALGELAETIRSFRDCRSSLMTQRVGEGLTRTLYATYVSYLPTEKFSYEVAKHEDPRGVFVEMLKTRDSGQFSYFTAHPGITRGGHYHHTKTEKFLVIKGDALFRFRHLITGELFELRTTGDFPQIVDTIPGWSHDITNVGNDEMIVMLWANENFDRQQPDTVASPI